MSSSWDLGLPVARMPPPDTARAEPIPPLPARDEARRDGRGHGHNSGPRPHGPDKATHDVVEFVRVFLPSIRERVIKLFPRSLHDDVSALSVVGEITATNVDDAVWTVQKLLRALSRISHGSTNTTDVMSVMAVLREYSTAPRAPFEVKLAPWMTPELIRADMEDGTSGNGVRCLAYALFTTLLEKDPWLYVVRHKRRWCLVLYGTYAVGKWMDVYVVLLSQNSTTPHRATVASHAGVRGVTLGPTDPVCAVRVSSALSKKDAMFVATHLMRASRATPIIPGSHVFAQLRDAAHQAGSEKLRDILPLLQDPYEISFTTYHACIQSFAGQGLTGAHIGAHYARNIISVLRMSGAADELETDSGAMCLFIKPHTDKHYRVANYERDVEPKVRRVVYTPSDEVDAAMRRLMEEVVTGASAAEIQSIQQGREAIGTYVTNLLNGGKDAVIDASSSISEDAKRAFTYVQSSWSGRAAAAGGAVVTLGLGLVAGPVLLAATMASAVAGRVLVTGATKALGAFAAGEETHMYVNFFVRVRMSGLTNAEIVRCVPPTHIAFHLIELARTTFPGGLANFQKFVFARFAHDTVGKENDGATWAACYLHTAECGGVDDAKRTLIDKTLAGFVSVARGLPTLAGDYAAASVVYWLLVAYYDGVSRQQVGLSASVYEGTARRMLYGESDVVGVEFECGDSMLLARYEPKPTPRKPVRRLWYPLDAVPLGACVFAQTGGQYTVWVRNAERMFDAYSVRAYDSEINLGNNRSVPIVDITDHIHKGVEIRGPLYDPMDVLDDALRTAARWITDRDERNAPMCAFHPATIEPAFARAALDGVDADTRAAYRELCDATEMTLTRNARAMMTHLLRGTAYVATTAAAVATTAALTGAVAAGAGAAGVVAGAGAAAAGTGAAASGVAGAVGAAAAAGAASGSVGAAVLSGASSVVAATGLYAQTTLGPGAAALGVAVAGPWFVPVASVLGVGALCYYSVPDIRSNGLLMYLRLQRALSGLVGGKPDQFSTAVQTGLLPHLEMFIRSSRPSRRSLRAARPQVSTAHVEDDPFAETYDPMALNAEALAVARSAIPQATRLLVFMNRARFTLPVTSQIANHQ